MKKSLLLIAGALSAALSASATVDNLLPRPQKVEAAAGALKVAGEARVTDPTGSTALLRALEEAGFTPGSAGVPVTVTTGPVEGAYDYRLAGYPAEAYCLKVTADGISITAPEKIGVIRAAQTLAQLAEDCDGTIPAVTVTDWPAFKLRGFMHDVGRSFIDIDELRKEIDLLSRFKVNTFHWHLTELLAWRLESKVYPQLTSAASMTRYPGMFYTIEQARELEAYAAERGVTVIPEIDMPGHSAAFERAMGFGMQTSQGREALKKILTEVCETFPLAPYIHIGGDEVKFDDSFIVEMLNHVHSLGRKAVIWNRYNSGPAKIVDPAAIPTDMVTNWATSGTLVSGIPNIDMRYNYTNHFDLFADVVGIYKSTIFGLQQGTPDVAGTISAAWSDTKTATQTDIIRQNNIYANILASASRAWTGGGRRYIEQGGTILPNSGDEFDDFADWERRFLHHKAGVLAGEPIPYVKQTDVVWRITDQIPNGGNAEATLAPEQYIGKDAVPEEFNVGGSVIGSGIYTGAGLYLRHIWHGTVKGIFGDPQNNMTAYAWTYVYSPDDRDAGALVETYTYSRSGNEKAPEAGKWDRRGSRLWVNGSEIAAPEWIQPGKNITQNHGTEGLTNYNVTAREPVKIRLRKGWNQVFFKLPHANSGGTARDKWQMTFVVTDTEGRDAMADLIYSPSKSMDGEPEPPAPNQPVENEIYYMQSNRDSRFATSKGVGAEIVGESAKSEAAKWRFEKHADGNWNFVNVADGSYVSPASANNTALRTSATAPATGWQILPSDDDNYVIIVNGTAQWNQTKNAQSYKVYNWGNGTNKSDGGCQYRIVVAPASSAPEQPEEPGDDTSEPVVTITDIDLSAGPVRIADDMAAPILAHQGAQTVAIDYTKDANDGKRQILVSACRDTDAGAFFSVFADNADSGLAYWLKADEEGWFTLAKGLGQGRHTLVVTMDDNMYHVYGDASKHASLNTNQNATWGFYTFGTTPETEAIYLGGVKRSDVKPGAQKGNFKGTIHSIRFYNRALSEAEVRSLVWTGLHTTGLESVATDTPARVKGIFDIYGRRLPSADAPGLYIIDGRKILVR